MVICYIKSHTYSQVISGKNEKYKKNNNNNNNKTNNMKLKKNFYSMSEGNTCIA